MASSLRIVLAPCLAFVVLASAECGHDHPAASSAEDAHEHAAVERALARLGDRYLVHLIHAELALGEPADLLLHGTRLDLGTPITDGAVEVVFHGPGEARVVARLSELKPGHWPGEVVLEATGPWRVEALVRTAAGEELVPLGEVEVHVDAHEAAHAPAPEAPSGGILFLFEQQWPLAMAFERAGPRPFVEQLAVSGRIEARPGAFAHVASLISGRVAAPPGGALPKPGQRVEAGDVIARVEQFLATPEKTGLQSLEYQQHQLRHELDLQQLEADRALSEARVRLQAGERVLERAERLRAESLGSQAEVDAARAEIELARAAQNAALSSLSSVQRLRNEHAEDPVVAASVFDLVAPIAGVLATVDLAIGESVEPGATLATVLDASIVWAVAEVPEHEIRRLENLGSARVLPRGLDLWLEAKKPVHVSPIVDPQTRFVEAAFEIENRDGRLRAGQLATVELAGDVVGDALSVPATSLFFEQGRPHVFVLHDGETFLKRRLKLGARDRDRVRVLAGLEAGEVIAATHAEELRLAALAGSGAIVEHHH